MAKQYGLIVYRFDEEEQVSIVDQYVTADQVIDVLVLAQSFEVVNIDAGEVEQESEEDEAEDEEPEEEEPTPKPNPLTTGRRASYDKAALIADVKANVLSTAELAAKYDVTSATIYQVRNKLKKDAGAEAEEPGETEYAKRQRERAALPTPDVNIEGEIKLLFIQGFSLSEVSDMYPAVPLERLSKLKSDARV